MSNSFVKPNFLCIGAQKAGTTWLHHNLRQHPQIWLPPYKEIHYFDQIHANKNEAQAIEKNRLIILKKELDKKINGEAVDCSYLSFLSHLAFSEIKDDAWYLSLFNSANSQQAVGEITPAYAALSEVGVKHIKNLLGDIHLIYILRNPIRRAWSQVRVAKRRDIVQKKQIHYQDWVDVIDVKYPLLKGDYKRTINIYEKYFKRERILYLFYDDICLNPGSLLQRICDFLCVNYDEKYFTSTVKSFVNSNPKVDMPQKVEEYLTQKYKSQEEFVIERFKPASFKL